MSTGENVQKWTSYFLLFFATRPSDEYNSVLSRKYSRPLLDLLPVSVNFWNFVYFRSYARFIWYLQIQCWIFQFLSSPRQSLIILRLESIWNSYINVCYAEFQCISVQSTFLHKFNYHTCRKYKSKLNISGKLKHLSESEQFYVIYSANRFFVHKDFE